MKYCLYYDDAYDEVYIVPKKMFEELDDIFWSRLGTKRIRTNSPAPTWAKNIGSIDDLPMLAFDEWEIDER